MNIRRMVFRFALLGAFMGAVLLPLSAQAKENYPVKGKVVAVSPIQDKLGSGDIVYSHFESYNEKEDETIETIHAYRFNREGGRLVKVWQINDGNFDGCNLGLAAVAFRGEGKPVITDLDGNGIKEIWTGYSYQCSSEVASANFKIIMYEGKKKYAMRGLTRAHTQVLTPSGEYNYHGPIAGGKGTMDAAFKSGPGVFRAYAQKLWNLWRDDL